MAEFVLGGAGLNTRCQRKARILLGLSQPKSTRLRCSSTCQSIGRNCSTLSFDLFTWLSLQVFWFKANRHRLEFSSTGIHAILVLLGSFLWCRARPACSRDKFSQFLSLTSECLSDDHFTIHAHFLNLVWVDYLLSGNRY